MIKIKKGLDLPVSGAPEQQIEDGPAIPQVALVGFDYPGMKPTMNVKVGDRVKLGQVVFSDKKTPGVKYTAPASGVVSAVNRGEKRVFQSLVIDVEGDDEETFGAWDSQQLDTLDRQSVVDNLVNSGLWTALRTRPFSKVPATDTEPDAVFVSVMDTNPLAGDPELVIAERKDDFVNGLRVLARLTQGRVFVTSKAGGAPPVPTGEQFERAEFSGPHPAGNVGTHIHFLYPVSTRRVVWVVGYQDVMTIGALFTTGRIDTRRVVALGGPMVKRPRLLRTRLGADLKVLTEGELESGNPRIISGSVLAGRHARGSVTYLGRYADQVSVISEAGEREFMGWLTPGANRFSVMNIYLSRFMPDKKFNFTSSTNGSPRAMVPTGNFEKVMPLDILPTQLLRALLTGDTELAQQLGCLELDEEDLGLCTFVCSGKYEYGPVLRDNLTRIEREG